MYEWIFFCNFVDGKFKEFLQKESEAASDRQFA